MTEAEREMTLLKQSSYGYFQTNDIMNHLLSIYLKHLCDQDSLQNRKYGIGG